MGRRKEKEFFLSIYILSGQIFKAFIACLTLNKAPGGAVSVINHCDTRVQKVLWIKMVLF